MIHLLSSAPNALQHEQKDQKTSTVTTPKWMTPLLLFIDLYEKVILGMFIVHKKIIMPINNFFFMYMYGCFRIVLS